MSAVIEHSPKFRAASDYRSGECMCSNPYPAGSTERMEYDLEMHRFHLEELRELYGEIKNDSRA